MNRREIVVRAARSIDLLDSKGALLRLDSLTILDLVVAMEQELGLPIPTENIRAEAFESVDSIVQLLDTLAAEAAANP